MRPAIETLFLNIPDSLRIFPEDDPEAIATIKALRSTLNEEQQQLFTTFLNQSNRLADEQALSCFTVGVHQGISLGLLTAE